MNPIRRRIFSRLLKERGGIAAVEFAFVAPVLILMFFGTVELSSALQCLAAVKSMASMTADIAAQATSISNSDESNIFAAVTAVLYPNSTTPAKIILTSIVDNGSGGGKVAWSDGYNGATAHAVNAVMTVPTGIMPSGGSVILAEVTYTYTSPTSVEITGPITMSKSSYSLPRLSTTISRVP